MLSTRHLRLLLLLLIVPLITISYYCTTPAQQAVAANNPDSKWRNVYDTSAHYVGMETCRGCHSEVYNTFIKTGMGQSFDHATRQKSAADFSPGHALVYDKDLDFYYKPHFDNDSLYITEYRLVGKDTVHKRTEVINYIVGSGQHTNSHIFSRNGYLYQAPITFYTQKHRWDLAPGFEKGGSSRFQRLIELECMTCHNGYPDFVTNSENKYTALKTGIDCERCHGPGSLHVADKSAGIIVDTSKGPDYTIVNPRRLPTELQNNICQRCHLQGISVLNDGKSFYDFHPGMRLSEVMNVFMPEYEGARDKMIMASHVERMKKSQCYVVSGKMSCITCHNPHVSVKFTPRTQYLNACKSCHGGGQAQQQCTENMQARLAKADDCVTCHMPHNGSIDIPHVAVTDHYIRKRPLDDSAKRAITAFIGLKCFNNDKVDAITTARAYLEFYERYNASKGLIDSAIHYLGRQQSDENNGAQNRDYIRAYFLLEDYNRVAQYAAALQPAQVLDAWTTYRIGQAYYLLRQPQQALPWYERAVQLLPYALDFQAKYGACLLALHNLPAAQKTFAFILAENPEYMIANSNLGFIYMKQGANTLAYEYLSRARALDPDHEQTLINLAIWHHNNGDNVRAKECLQSLLRRHPANDTARRMLADLAAGK